MSAGRFNAGERRGSIPHAWPNAMHDAITYSGPIRLYFDPTDLGDANWCISGVESHWHINVRTVSIDGVHLRTVYAPTDDSRPRCTTAWLEGRANITITPDGRAFLKPEEQRQ